MAHPLFHGWCQASEYAPGASLSMISLFIMVLLFLLVPFAFLILVMPYSIRMMLANGFSAEDMYKADRPKVAINGGLLLLLIALFSMSILSLFYSKYILPENHAMIMVIVLFALFGLVDDM